MTRRKPPLPKGSRAVMASRIEPQESADLFPTPPWATRALCEVVLPRLGIPRHRRSVWEPACGQGHMAEVLCEYFRSVTAMDIDDHGYRGTPTVSTGDFLTVEPRREYHWIITNPPFGGKTLPFVLRALDLATQGVAIFVSSRWYCEGVERYEKLFKPKPPTLFASFTERVNLCRDRWDPDGSTATSYCWLVWVKDASGKLEPEMKPFKIPHGQRKALTRPDDRARFAAWTIELWPEALKIFHDTSRKNAVKRVARLLNLSPGCARSLVKYGLKMEREAQGETQLEAAE